MIKTFSLIRWQDVSETSGVGKVAEGVQFTDGTVAIRWCVTDLPASTVIWDSIEDAIAIHGHDGKTEISWNSV